MTRIILSLKVLTFLAHIRAASPKVPRTLPTASSTKAAVFPKIAYSALPKHIPPLPKVPPFLPAPPLVPGAPHFPDLQHLPSPTVAPLPSTITASPGRATSLSTTSSSTTAASPLGISRLRTAASLKTTSSRRTTTSLQTNATTLSVTWTRLKMFIKKITKRCDFTGLDAVYTDIKDLWSKVMKDERKQAPNEMEEARNILKKLVEHYSECDEKDYGNVEAEWERYTKVFGKEHIAGEKEMRKQIFKKKMKDVEKHNELYKNGKVTYSTALNHFSDWVKCFENFETEEELQKKNGFRPLNGTLDSDPKRIARFLEGIRRRLYKYNSSDAAPPSFDWRTKGCGACGSCYAFAGVGALEAYSINKTGNVISLSAQNILDCTWYLGNSGCDGGDPFTVFHYAKDMGVLPEYLYPYMMNASHDCRWRREAVIATDRGYYFVESRNELALRNAVAIHGPVAVGVGTVGLDEYRSDVFVSENCGPIKHGVLVIGYGTNPEYGDYWIVKDNYGFWYGEDGYVRMARNKNNMCGIATAAYFPY